MYAAFVPETSVIPAPLSPGPSRSKSAAPTPVTSSSNVTDQLTVAAFVGLGSSREIEVTLGAFASTATEASFDVAVQASLKSATTRYVYVPDGVALSTHVVVP